MAGPTDAAATAFPSDQIHVTMAGGAVLRVDHRPFAGAEVGQGMLVLHQMQDAAGRKAGIDEQGMCHGIALKPR